VYGSGSNVRAALGERYKRDLDAADRLGYADPVGVVARGAWLQATILAGLYPARAAEYGKVRDDLERAWNFDARVVKAAMGEVAGGGANIIATPVESELNRLIRDNTVVRPLARKIQMTSLTHQLPQENVNLQSFIMAETGLVSDAYGNNTTGFSQIALTARKFGALATVSSELLEDNIVALQDYLFTAIAEDMGILEDRAAIEGLAAGVNFTGVANAATNTFTVTGNTSGGDAPSYGDLVKAIYLGSTGRRGSAVSSSCTRRSSGRSRPSWTRTVSRSSSTRTSRTESRSASWDTRSPCPRR